MSEKKTKMQDFFITWLLFVLSISLFFQSRGCSNILTESWLEVDFPQHYEEQFMEAKIIKIEQDGIPPLIKIHILSKSGCTYIISPAGRTLSLENIEEVEADSKCPPKTSNTKQE